MGGHKSAERIEARVEIGGLLGLHEAEMALGQRNVRLAGQGAEHGQAESFDRLGRETPVPFAADLVDDDAGDADARIVGRAALGDGGGGLRLVRTRQARG